MNILCTSHTADYRGSAVSICELMKRLDRSRFRPFALFSKIGPLISDLKAHGIASSVIAKKGFLRIATVREALRIIDREKIGLVHLNSAVPFSKYVAIAARMRRLPVLWHIREDPHGKKVKRLKPWIRLLANRIVVNNTEMERAFGTSKTVVKIYNGVDTECFHPGPDSGTFRKGFGIPPEAFVFGIVGTIEENKGTQNFIKAAKLLLESAPQAYFAVVGDGSPHDVRRILDLVRTDSRLQERTIMTGRLANIPEVMLGLDVLVVASSYESFSRVLIESMACGKPAIATEVVEIPHIVEHGKTGFLIPPNSISALRGAMECCISSRSQLGEMGERAREKALREFSIEKHVERVQAVYEEVLGLDDTR